MRRWLALVLLGMVAALAIASGSRRASATSAARPVRAPSSERAAPRANDITPLVEPLRASDPYVVVGAAQRLAATRVTAAIPALAAIDIRNQPASAPSVITALGRLAADADPTNRQMAAQRLIDLLAQEKARTAPEVDGNILQIYEALGMTNETAAAPPLEAELSDPRVRLAAQVVVVDSLVRLRAPTSRGALMAARARVAAATVARDAFEEEIRRELLAKIDHALVVLAP